MIAEPVEANMSTDPVSIDVFVYGVEPIDVWLGWSDEAQFRASVERWCPPQGRSAMWAFYEAFRDKAMELARGLGWQGDIRDGPFIAGMPTFEIRHTSLFLVAWKQDDDGLTFVASPVELPWLAYNETAGRLEN
jgi:hypothetical protein